MFRLIKPQSWRKRYHGISSKRGNVSMAEMNISSESALELVAYLLAKQGYNKAAYSNLPKILFLRFEMGRR